MIVRMWKNGDSRDESAVADIVKEVYELEQAAVEESQKKMELTVILMTENMMEYVNDGADRLMLSQLEYTDHVEFFKLRADLIEHQNCQQHT